VVAPVHHLTRRAAPPRRVVDWKTQLRYATPMRVRKTQGDLTVHTIVGTRVALFGMDLPKTAITDLMGFAIRRTDHDGGSFYLQNALLFKANDRGPKSNHSSLQNPFQEFLWGDYTLLPERSYTYRVTARYGEPGKLRSGVSVELEITTESEDDDLHAVFFNRGVAGSQRYATLFDNKKPDDVGAKAFDWLSRGLEEGLLDFIRQATGPTMGLRAAVYEFTHPPLVHEFTAAVARGADVQIVYDCVKNTKNYPASENTATIAAEQLTDRATKRTLTRIAHNKFIVLLEGGQPTEVWTGSTNFTKGALFGQSNVGHIIRDATVAKRYLDYWNVLQGDPPRNAARAWDDQNTPTPAAEPPAAAMTSLFSPRKGLSALDWYATQMDGARESVFLTAAFGVSKQLSAIFAKQKPYLRYLLLDKPDQVTTVNRNSGNRAVAGGYLGQGEWGQWLRESLTDLNNHVRYVHTKYMLIDPLGDDPIVITGSANFSESSTLYNDENMLVIRGNTRVADIYLGEFMRLFTHFRFRGKTKAPRTAPIPSADSPGPPAGTKLYLRDTDYWARRFYFKNTPREAERRLFR
jgi:phosphatidylserine/phosphatidylglycerophosphate/cardiolipin synthase-like enzyme